MSSRLLQFTFNATVQVIDNNTNGLSNTTYVSDGQDWANFVNRTDATCVNEQGPQLQPNTTTVIPLPVGAANGVAIAWQFSQKVTMVFNYGSIPLTSYGIQQGQFTTLSVTTPNTPGVVTTGHIVLLGA